MSGLSRRLVSHLRRYIANRRRTKRARARLDFTLSFDDPRTGSNGWRRLPSLNGHTLDLSTHGLGLVATAEGVETVDQLRAVHELGCDVVQGYLISPPLDGDELIPWKAEFRKRWPSLLTDESLELWSDIEADALGQR